MSETYTGGEHPVVGNYSGKGWTCPNCNAVMAPNVPTCVYCTPKPKTEQTEGGQQCLMESK